ncbi:MAG: response regulator [Clostridiales bacterium]|jgi:two-component system response regulator YesN|nr:response regulator [Clostridiales bacterium]
MYKVVLVDDESYALKKLSAMALWNDLGFEIAAAFSDSQKALDFLRENRADVLVTDIKMPRVSGLELAKICQEQYPDMIVAILSAYHDFKYAQTAIKYCVFDFLTKPVVYTDVVNTMRRIKDALGRRASARVFMNTDSTLAIQKMFADSVRGAAISPAEISAKFQAAGIPIDADLWQCARMRLKIKGFDDYMERVWKYDILRFYKAVSSIITFESADCFSVMLKHFLGDGEFIIICKNDGIDRVTEEVADGLETSLKELLRLDCSVTAAGKYPSLNAMLREPPPDTEFDGRRKNEIIGKVIAYIEEHYSESITSNDVARHVNLSTKYFGNYFKRHVGENFVNFVNRYRIEKSIEFMADDRNTITAICEMVGFKNQTYFYNLFRKYYHLSPFKYKEKFFSGRK